MNKLRDRAAGSLQGSDVSRLVVGDAVGPAAVQDADPLVGQGAQDRPVADFFRLLLLPVGARPAEDDQAAAALESKP